MSQLDSQFVKRGFWNNNPAGLIMGPTITTDIGTGNVVIALVAVLTTFSIGHLWNLVVFTYHQMRVNIKPADGLHVQHQVLMRTLPQPSSMLSDLLKLWRIWRKRIDRASLRSVPLISLALIFASGTISVGIFSSYLVDTTSITVLVSSPHCGPIDYLGETVVDEISEQAYKNWDISYRYRIADLANRYARDCYANLSETSERCKIFVRPTIPSRRHRTSCPFEKSMCKNLSQPGLAFDTELLDLNDYFGLNLATDDKMRFRKTMSCSILELEGHYQLINKTSPLMSQLDLTRWLGRQLYAEEEIRAYKLGVSRVAEWTRMITYMPIGDGTCISASPTRHFSSPILNHTYSSFEPIQQLKRNDSDLILNWLVMNDVRYTGPVDDPLFSAHRPYSATLTNNDSLPLYLPDEPASLFGCQHQYQFCFAQQNQNEKCTSLQGLPAIQTLSNFTYANKLQMALWRSLIRILLEHDAGMIIYFIPFTSLASSYNDPFPVGQWIQQLTLLENSAIAQIQIALSTYSIGASTLGISTSTPMRHNETEEEQQLCALQRMNSPGGFVNIGVFPLALVIIICAVFIILDMLLLKFLIFSQRFRPFISPRIDSWIQDGVFQLQRRAYEAHSQGVWNRLEKEIPATADDVKFTHLPKHSITSCQCNTSLLSRGSTGSLGAAGSSQSEIQSSASLPQTGATQGQMQAQFPLKRIQKKAASI